MVRETKIPPSVHPETFDAVIAPHTTPPPASVVRALEVLHDGSAKLSPPAEMERPPANVDVADPVRLMMPELRMMPPVKVKPPDEESPEVPADMPLVNVLVAEADTTSSPAERRIPPVRVRPWVEEIPEVKALSPPLKVEEAVVEVAVR